MANKPATKRKGKREPTDQLNVRIPTELYRRVSSVAGASGKTLTQFVSVTLDERTKDHKEDVARIAEREKQPKKWQ
jgi:predicted HicB family RNase H-like nuclease